MAAIDALLRTMMEREGSDLHLSVGLPPRARISGSIQPIGATAIPDRHPASMTRTWFCSSAGNELMIRSTVFGALFVCRVPKTSMPIEAQLSASFIVSSSRISPISRMSGSWRMALFRAAGNDFVCSPTSRCTMMLFFTVCTNSIGSSIVMMCRHRFVLM